MIFLELIQQDISLWVNDLQKTYNHKEELSIEEFASLWIEIFMKHERLASLIPILFTSLEKNATLQSLTNFKIK